MESPFVSLEELLSRCLPSTSGENTDGNLPSVDLLAQVFLKDKADDDAVCLPIPGDLAIHLRAIAAGQAFSVDSLFSLLYLAVCDDVVLSGYHDIRPPLLLVLESSSLRCSCPPLIFSMLVLLCEKLLDENSSEDVRSSLLSSIFVFLNERVDVLPPSRLLDSSIRILLASPKGVSGRAWSSPLRLLATRLLRTRELPLLLQQQLFVLLSAALSVVGSRFLSADGLFTRTLSAMAEVHLRLQLESAAAGTHLGPTFQLLEEIFAIAEGDDDDSLPDDLALTTATSLRSVCLLLSEYCSECSTMSGETKELVACFLSRQLEAGVAEMLPKENVNSLLEWFLVSSEAEGGTAVAAAFLRCADSFPLLSPRVLSLLAKMVNREYPDGHWQEAAKIAAHFILTTNRVDFFDEDSLSSVKELLNSVPDNELTQDVTPAAEGVRISQPQVVAYFDDNSLGDGTLTIAESCVTWVNRASSRGFSLGYRSIIVHAVSTDLSSFPHECLLLVADASCAGRRPLRRRFIPLLTASEASIRDDIAVEESELRAGGDEEGEEEEGSDGGNIVIRFVPADTSALTQMYEEMSACQELNPEDDDDFSEEDEMAEGEEEQGAAQHSTWYTADNLEGAQLSEEGRANLERIFGNGHGNGHHEEGDTKEDEAGMEE